jgi:hypothetical protein
MGFAPLFNRPGLWLRATEPSLTGSFIRRSASPGYSGVMKIPAFLLLIGLILLPAVHPASAGETDHDRARRAVESGEIKPLRDILAEAEKTHGGQLIEAELEHEHGRMVYELKLLTVEGRVVKLYYDARSGMLLQRDGHDRRK